MMITSSTSTACSSQISQADLYIYQGDSYAAEIQVYKPDETPADLTGYTAAAQIRFGPADEFDTILAEPTLTIDEANGKISMSFTKDQTAALLGGRFSWDLQLTAPDGTVTTILAGNVIVQQEITRIPPAAMRVVA